MCNDMSEETTFQHCRFTDYSVQILPEEYLEQKMPNYGKWPNLPSKKYINLTVIEKAQKATLDYSSALVYGNIQAVRRKSDISFQDVVKCDENGVLPRFVLVEGAPGVG